MNRRKLLKLAAASSLLAAGMPLTRSSADPASAPTGKTRRRLRPSDPSWPSLAEWEGLNQAVGGRLMKIESSLAACADNPDTSVCQEMLRNLRNPFFIGDQPWGTQIQRLGRRLGVVAERLCGRRQSCGRRRGRGRFRPRTQFAPRRQRRRAQLSRHVERARFAADLDAGDGQDRAARRICAAEL
jgi:hypothetical protein